MTPSTMTCFFSQKSLSTGLEANRPTGLDKISCLVLRSWQVADLGFYFMNVYVIFHRGCANLLYITPT